MSLFLERRLEFEFIQKNILLILLALGSGGAWLFLTFRGASGKSGLSPTQATMLINREDAQIIDVRGADEYAGGHLPDSRNIPLEQLEARVEELDKLKNTPLILVCQTGMRAVNACRQLEKLGFTKANNLSGGIAGWRAAGLPLRKGAKK
ncbi:rhodanese-like domain-containing protein [Betaproteobacteria bacterium]|nr:rhodanese-like domain-containing protein [Betaproteobacteria bacterium]